MMSRMVTSGVTGSAFAGLVTSASGQRACGSAASVSVSPSARRSAPAQAIMAPLSVHSSGGGAAGTDQRGRLAVLLAENLEAGAQPVGDDLDHALLERGAHVVHVGVAQRR